MAYLHRKGLIKELFEEFLLGALAHDESFTYKGKLHVIHTMSLIKYRFLHISNLDFKHSQQLSCFVLNRCELRIIKLA